MRAPPVSILTLSSSPGVEWLLTGDGSTIEKTLYDDVPDGIASNFTSGPNDAGYGLSNGQLWANNRAFDMADLMSEEDYATYGDVEPMAISSNSGLVGGQIASGGGSWGEAALTLPVQLEVVSRDSALNTWSNAYGQPITKPVYSGNTTGDMVSWKIGGTDSWTTANFTWTALGPNNITITGPSGLGQNQWQISNASPFNGNSTLTWLPGNYTINCTITLASNATIPISFVQQVGWRTEDYLVIGQIITTDQYDDDGPSFSQTLPFRDAVFNDVPVLAVLGSAVENAFLVLPVPNSGIGDVEMSYWAAVPVHSITPQGPFSASGAVTSDMRFWMMENILNQSIDTPQAPTTLAATALLSTINAQQYRILNHYQTCFLLTDNGTIDGASLQNLYATEATGNTKLIFVPAGIFADTGWSASGWEFNITAETNPNNGLQESSDGTRVSNYVSGRVGSEGQNANWRMQGQDVPWVFAEIINTVNSDRTVQLSVNTSVDISFANGATTSGSSPFNNLNIYHAELNSVRNQINYTREGYLPMNYHLEPFIDSVSYGTWPTPAPTPSVQ